MFILETPDKMKSPLPRERRRGQGEGALNPRSVIAVLRTIQAQVRFLSVEPLLEDVGAIDLKGIHWVIVGGESGHGARPMRKEWVDSIKRQCDQAGVAFFFKQWGAWGADGQKRSKKANGRTYRGKIYDSMPDVASAIA